jgi:omega-amidase
VRVAVVQHDIIWEDPAANHARLAPMVETAVAGGARLIILTEMYATGFSMAPERIAEPPDGPSIEFLAAQAADHGVWVCGSIATRDPDLDRPVNRLVLAGPDGQRHHYDKIHPFSYDGEHEHYAAGTEYLTIDVEGVRTSFFVCYDLRFADSFWELADASDCYVVVANWPEPRRSHWQALLVGRAIENQAYVVGANRVGLGGEGGAGARYTGDSRIVDPMGEVLAAAAGTETVLSAEVDPAVVAEVRRRLPFMADRRRPTVAY